MTVRREPGASVVIQFHRWRGFGFDWRRDLFFTFALMLGWVSVLGYGGVLDMKLAELRNALIAALDAKGREDGR